MPCIAEVNAVEGSTYVVTATFTDESGDEITPKTLVWSLSDMQGNIINSRLNVVITPTGSTEKVALYGDDLQIAFDSDAKREIQFTGTYDNDLGSDLPIIESLIFDIENIAYPNKDD